MSAGATFRVSHQNGVASRDARPSVAIVAPSRRSWARPLDVGVGIGSTFAGACIVGWALLQPTIGGMIAAACGATMVFVGGAWTRKALSA